MKNKKKLGIIGGMGSRAGALFFKKIIDYSPADTDQEFLDIILHNNSAIPDRTRAIIHNERSPLNDILCSIEMFNRYEVDTIALACITSYYYYQQISAFTSANVINPLYLIAEHIRNELPRAKRIGLMATTGTIRTGLFHRELADCNVEIVTLSPQDQEMLFMKAVYMRNGFKSARISDEAVALMHQSREKLIDMGVDAIIGGCTEVSLGVKQEHMEVPYIDTLDLLARKTVDYCYNTDVKKNYKSNRL